jgi:hypothetical protein
VRREHLVSRSQSAASHSAKESDVQPWFGVRTCQLMLETMLSLEDIDIDLLVLLRDEVHLKKSFSELHIFRSSCFITKFHTCFLINMNTCFLTDVF